MTPKDKLLFNAVTADFSTPEGREAIFQYYKSKDLMSGDTFEDFAKNLKTKISAKKGDPKNILKEILGKNYEGIPLTISKGEIGVDHYKYGDTIPRPLEDYLTDLYGEKEVKAFKRAYGKSWTDMSTAAQALFDKYGIRFDRGHFTANYRGGAKLFGASLERALANQMHGADHRAINDEAAKNLLTTGRSSSWLEDFFQHKLANDNLDVLGAKYLTPADFEAINKGADANQLLLERLDQAERSGVKPNTNILTAELEASGFDTLEDLDRHKAELINRQIVETGIHPQSGQEVGSLSIQKAQSKIQGELDRGVTTKPRGKEAWLNTIQGLNKKGVPPNLTKLDPVNPGVTTPTTPTPETPTATKRLPKIVSYEDQFVKQAYSEKDANMLREWLSDLRLDGWGDSLSKLPKLPKIPAWAKVGTAATLYGLYGDVTQAAETSQEVQEEGWGPRQVMEATSAATGLASLIPPLAPVTAPISLVTGVTGAAMGRREDQQELRQDQLENPQNYRWNKDNTKFERIPEPSYNDPGPLTIEPTQTATQVINQQRLDLIESGKLKAEGDDPISRTVSGAVDWLTNWYKKEEN